MTKFAWLCHLVSRNAFRFVLARVYSDLTYPDVRACFRMCNCDGELINLPEGSREEGCSTTRSSVRRKLEILLLRGREGLRAYRMRRKLQFDVQRARF